MGAAEGQAAIEPAAWTDRASPRHGGRRPARAPTSSGVLHAAGDDVVALDAGRRSTSPTATPSSLSCRSQPRPMSSSTAAAWTAVDACEADPDRAYAANALAVRWVAEACRRAGAHLVHLSTDYVFDGDKPDAVRRVGRAATRSASTAPRKLAGEREAARLASARRSCGRRGCAASTGSNMVKTILRLLDRAAVHGVRRRPARPSHVHRRPGASRCARLAVERRPGVHHVTNQGAVSWFEFAREVAVGRGGARPRPGPTDRHEGSPASPRRAPARELRARQRRPALSGIPLLPDFRGCYQPRGGPSRPGRLSSGARGLASVADDRALAVEPADEDGDGPRIVPEAVPGAG